MKQIILQDLATYLSSLILQPVFQQVSDESARNCVVISGDSTADENVSPTNRQRYDVFIRMTSVGSATTLATSIQAALDNQWLRRCSWSGRLKKITDIDLIGTDAAKNYVFRGKFEVVST